MRIVNGMVLCCALVGCAVDDEEAVSTVDQALSWRTVWARFTTNALPIDLGSDANQTCFLSGVSGDLNTGYQWHEGERSNVRVFRENGRYFFEVDSGKWDQGTEVGRKLGGHASCVNITTNRQEALWTAGDWPKIIQPTASKRQCFLSGVYGTGGTWVSSSDNVRVKKSEGNWVLDGTVDPDPWSGSHPAATAVCIDFPSETSLGNFTHYGPASANVIWDSEQEACGLTGMEGKFNVNDWDNGVMLSWPASWPGWWTASVSSGKIMWSTCVQ